MPDVAVNLAHSPYSIHIARGSLADLGHRLRDEADPSRRAVLMMDAQVTATHGAAAHQSLSSAGFDVVALEIIAHESLKSLETVRSLYERMLDAGVERGTPVVAVGGGIVGDTAGFAAATFLRGLPFVQVPTTLLAMVDASIGGKTGVNIEVSSEQGRPRPRPLSHPRPSSTPESPPTAETSDDSNKPGLGTGRLAKNMIGAFHQPKFVLVDPETLRTLNEREYRCGLAECIKHGMIAGAEHLTFIASHYKAILALDMEVVEQLITASVSIKARIVEEDERESGLRALLNLGHTFGHAIESIRELDCRHGEAVAIGLCAASITSELTQRLRPDEAASLRQFVALLGLPTRLPRTIDVDELLRAMRHDKKVRNGRLRLILPTAIGQAEIFDDVDETIVRETWRRVSLMR